jgi:hypothetical protein
MHPLSSPTPTCLRRRPTVACETQLGRLSAYQREGNEWLQRSNCRLSSQTVIDADHWQWVVPVLPYQRTSVNFSSEVRVGHSRKFAPVNGAHRFAG